MPVRVDVRGDFACFTRPEMKVERVSYEIMTPSAARGILTAIYWHPGIRWRIDAISVHSPIQYCSLKVNEVTAVAYSSLVLNAMNRGKGNLGLSVTDNRTQRTTQLLRNVHYVIDAHFEITDKSFGNMNNAKVISIFNRRVEKGQCFAQPYLGCREFPAIVTPCSQRPPCPDELKGKRDLGWMLYDMDWEAFDASPCGEVMPKPLFFRASLDNGILYVPSRYSKEVIG